MGRRTILLAWSLVALTAPASAWAIDLTGRVESTDGAPLEGATAVIYTAGVRVGTSPYCPTCYLDCGKKGTTDAAGRFAIKGLDASLVFSVIVLAKGHQPIVLAGVDPLDGNAIAQLKARPALPDDPQRVIRTRVVDDYDRPVVGATVAVNARELAGGVTTGRPKGIDLVTFADERGELVIVADEPILSVNLFVEAEGFARRLFLKVRPGSDVIELALPRGHAFAGRVLRDGKPLANAVVGLVQMNRSMDHNFVGEYTAVTDQDGAYRFASVPPSDDYCLYGKMESISRHGGAIAEVRLTSGGDSSVTTVDDLHVGPAHSLQGRVVLDDGQPVPPDTRLIVSRDRAWDSQIVPIDPRGEFRVDGMPTEVCTLTVQVPGYRMSPRNRSLDRLNPFQLLGLVDGDVGPLTVLLEPGEPEYVYGLPTSEQQAIFQARNKLQATRLEGAE